MVIGFTLAGLLKKNNIPLNKFPHFLSLRDMKSFFLKVAFHYLGGNDGILVVNNIFN
jgi:hypothetical protein